MFSINRKTILIVIFFVARILLAQQNTILIIADDVSPDYFGCFSTTTDTANTPTIRALASNGIKFTKVWAAPVCSPTRAGILTGRYSFRTGVGGVIESATSPQIDTAEMSIAKLLKYHAPINYNTACIGKWHLTVNQPMKRLYPNKMGFDLYSGNFNGAIPNYYNYVRVKNGIMDTVTTYATTQTINDAIDWMDTMNTDKPFFLWLAFNAPHDPLHLPPSTLCNTTGLSGTTAHITANPEKYFKAAIEAMDSEIGRLLVYLKSKKIADSTNIIFIGDNGNSGKLAQISDPMKAKGSIYNYGVHVPMIVSGPAVAIANGTSNALINTSDLYATIAELSDFQNWKNAIPHNTIVDSKSFFPILKNQKTEIRNWIFSETFNSPSTDDDGKTIRNQDYHLLRFDNGKEAFYNQTLDIEENHNLLVNPSTMTPSDIFNYQLLCDSLAALTTISGCLPVDIKENNLAEEFSIHPNPTHGLITIKLSGNNVATKGTRIDILNSLAQTILSKSITENESTLDLSSLQDGMYFILLYQNKKIVTKKFRKH